LDPNLRSDLCREVLNILKETRTTALIVTHDQQEAFSIADKIGIIFSGSLLQWSTPYNLYHRPKTANIARFIGEGAFITGTQSKNRVETSLGSFILEEPNNHKTKDKELVRVLLRPDDIIHDDSSSMEAKVIRKDFRGSDFLYTLELNNGEKVLSLVPSHHDHPVNKPIGIKLEMNHVITFSSEETAEPFTSKV
jgi:iron(III) transport system ATP-binding protein